MLGAFEASTWRECSMWQQGWSPLKTTLYLGLFRPSWTPLDVRYNLYKQSELIFKALIFGVWVCSRVHRNMWKFPFPSPCLHFSIFLLLTHFWSWAASTWSLFLFLSSPIDASSKTGASPHQHQRMSEFNLNLPNDPGPPALLGRPSPRGGLSLLGRLLPLRSE